MHIVMYVFYIDVKKHTLLCIEPRNPASGTESALQPSQRSAGSDADLGSGTRGPGLWGSEVLGLGFRV